MDDTIYFYGRNKTDYLKEAREAFCDTIALKMQQLYKVVPKGSNSALTGAFVEELVRGFLRDWLSPSLLLHGTLFPHDIGNQSDPECESAPLQIDGIVFDPKIGPPIIREGGFIVAHPRFCQGIIEIKTSCSSIRSFEDRSRHLHRQYLRAHGFEHTWNATMGIVIQDSDPDSHSHFEGLADPVFAYGQPCHCPIFILFREDEGDYKPFIPAVDSMMKAVFTGPWHIVIGYTGRPRYPLQPLG